MSAGVDDNDYDASGAAAVAVSGDGSKSGANEGRNDNDCVSLPHFFRISFPLLVAALPPPSRILGRVDVVMA